MAFQKTWQFSENYVPTNASLANVHKNIIWFWTRVGLGDPAAGLSWKDLAGATITTPVGVWKTFWSCKGTGTVAGTDFGATTTIAAGSNGAALPQGTINVASTTGFPASGTFCVVIANVPQVITYTGTSGGNAFTGCTGGTGTLLTAQAVYDNRDLWGSTFNAANIVQAAAASNHSWYVLYSQTNFGGTGQGPFYIMIDCSNATAGNIGNVFMSKTAPTGGTGTAAPTATDSVPITTLPSVFGDGTGSTTYHCSGRLSTDGMFRTWWTRDGGGTFVGTFRVDAFADAVAGDLWPVAFLCYGGNSGGTNVAGGVFTHGAAASLTGAATVANGLWRGRSADGTAITSFVVTHPAWHDTTNAQVTGQPSTTGIKTGTNQATGKWDQIPELGLYAVQPGYSGKRGRLFDSYFGPGIRAWTTRLVADATFDSVNQLMVIGDTWEPATVAHIL